MDSEYTHVDPLSGKTFSSLLETANPYKVSYGSYDPLRGGWSADPTTWEVDIPSIYPEKTLHHSFGASVIKDKYMEEYLDRDISSAEVKAVTRRKTVSPGRQEYAVSCDNMKDLSPENIMKTLSVMKSELMMRCAPVRVKNIECKMTTTVKNNLIQANRRLSMYGKKRPIVACFDEYCRRLPDEIHIDTLEGMTVQIIDESEYGPLYLAFTGIVDTIDFEFPGDIPF